MSGLTGPSYVVVTFELVVAFAEVPRRRDGREASRNVTDARSAVDEESWNVVGSSA